MSVKFTDLDGPDTNGHNVYSAVMAAVRAGLPMPAGLGVDEGTAYVRLRDEADRLVWARRLQFHGVVGGRWGTRWVALTVASQRPVTAAAAPVPMDRVELTEAGRAAAEVVAE